MQLVTSVLILPPRGVLITAKQFAALDILTGGRVIAGVGTGSMYREYQMVGMSSEEMGPRFEEAVQALRAYLTPEDPPFTGRFYDTTGVSMEPRAVQQPIRADLDRELGSAVRASGGWRGWRTAGSARPVPATRRPEQYEKDVALLNTYLVEEGKDPATFPNAVSTMALFVSDDANELAEHGGPGFVPRPAGVGVHQPSRARPTIRTPTTWSARAPTASRRSGAGRRPAPRRCSWCRAALTRSGRCAASWTRSPARHET